MGSISALGMPFALEQRTFVLKIKQDPGEPTVPRFRTGHNKILDFAFARCTPRPLQASGLYHKANEYNPPTLRHISLSLAPPRIRGG